MVMQRSDILLHVFGNYSKVNNKFIIVDFVEEVDR